VESGAVDEKGFPLALKELDRNLAAFIVIRDGGATDLAWPATLPATIGDLCIALDAFLTLTNHVGTLWMMRLHLG